MAGGGLRSLDGVAPEGAVSPVHAAEAAGGHARDQSHERRLMAPVSPRSRGLLGSGEGPGWRRGVGILGGHIRRQSPALPPTHPERRWATGALLVERSQDQATAGGRGRGADVQWADGAAYAAERVPSPSLLWSPGHVPGQAGEDEAHRADGGAGSVDQGDLSHGGAEDLSRSRAGPYGARSVA